MSEAFQLYDYQIRYTSSAFALFLNLFIGSEDSVAIALFKIQIIKALLVACMITFAFYLTIRFPKVKSLTTELLICVFSFPYTIFMAASIYTASIATIALVVALLVLRIIETEVIDDDRTSLILIIALGIASVLIVVNRFETTVFFAFAVAIFVLQNLGRMRSSLKLLTFPSTAAAVVGFSILLNPAVQIWIQKILRQDAKVLETSTAATSVVVEKIGDAGLTLTAPLTFFDNSSRNLVSGIGDSPETLGFQSLFLLMMSWVPLVILIAFKLFNILKSSWKSEKTLRHLITNHYPTLLTLFLFLFIPYFARTIWFLHYAQPLLCVFLMYSKVPPLNTTTTRVLILLGVVSNIVTALTVIARNGTIRINDYAIETHVQIVGFALAVSALLITLWRMRDLIAESL